MPLTAEQAALVLGRQFPEFAHARVSYLGEGCDSTAFEVDGAWVFRFPKHVDVDRQLRVETGVLRAVAGRTPLPVPSISYVGEPAEGFPYRFTGYRKLSGIPGIRLAPDRVPYRRVAPSLGRFLSWLHTIPLEELEGVPLQARDVAELVREVQTEALEDFCHLGDLVSGTTLTRWRRFLESGLPPDQSGALLSLVHNDLAAEHILLDPETYEVTGILDWADAEIGHPIVDLAGMFHWGGASFFEAVVEAYHRVVDRQMFETARFLAACRGVGDVTFGVQNSRPEYVAAGLRALTLTIE